MMGVLKYFCFDNEYTKIVLCVEKFVWREDLMLLQKQYFNYFFHEGMLLRLYLEVDIVHAEGF